MIRIWIRLVTSSIFVSQLKMRIQVASLIVFLLTLSAILAKDVGHRPLLKDNESLYKTICNQTIEDDPLTVVNWYGVASAVAGVVIEISMVENPIFGAIIGVLDSVIVSSNIFMFQQSFVNFNRFSNH